MSTYYHNLRDKLAERKLHIRPPKESEKELREELKKVKKEIQSATPEDIEFAEYIAQKHENTDKEFENIVNKHNKGKKWEGHVRGSEGKEFVRRVLSNKGHKGRYPIFRPHMLESKLNYNLGLPSDIARPRVKPNAYPSYHAAWSSYLGEHAKRQIPRRNAREVNDLINRVIKSRHILGYHTPQDTTEGRRIGKAYALKQLRRSKEASMSTYYHNLREKIAQQQESPLGAPLKWGAGLGAIGAGVGAAEDIRDLTNNVDFMRAIRESRSGGSTWRGVASRVSDLYHSADFKYYDDVDAKRFVDKIDDIRKLKNVRKWGGRAGLAGLGVGAYLGLHNALKKESQHQPQQQQGGSGWDVVTSPLKWGAGLGATGAAVGLGLDVRAAKPHLDAYRRLTSTLEHGEEAGDALNSAYRRRVGDINKKLQPFLSHANQYDDPLRQLSSYDTKHFFDGIHGTVPLIPAKHKQVESLLTEARELGTKTYHNQARNNHALVEKLMGEPKRVEKLKELLKLKNLKKWGGRAGIAGLGIGLGTGLYSALKKESQHQPQQQEGGSGWDVVTSPLKWGAGLGATGATVGLGQGLYDEIELLKKLESRTKADKLMSEIRNASKYDQWDPIFKANKIKHQDLLAKRKGYLDIGRNSRLRLMAGKWAKPAGIAGLGIGLGVGLYNWGKGEGTPGAGHQAAVKYGPSAFPTYSNYKSPTVS